AELLRKAVIAADATPAAPHRIRIRTNRNTRVRAMGTKSDPPDQTETMLRAAHYNYDDPLSARSFSAWRDQLAEKRDQVSMADNRYRIRTTTSTGELASATLQLRMSDLYPVQERFEFRNRDWMEVEELGAEQTPAPGLVAHGNTPAAAVTP